MSDIAALCLDFETANYDAASALALGLCAVDHGGGIVFKQSWLIRPEGRLYIRRDFIDIHGITPDMVRDAPTFRELWQDQFAPWFAAAPLLVAHNAGFDRRVLDGTMTRAEIDMPRKNWLCTVQLSRRSWPGLYNHKLSTVCAHIGFDLNHHDAGSDSEACAHILRAAAYFTQTQEKPDYAHA
ncbi:MAG: 3'-5' exonuclease [Alphaproteobacteria bacterium]|nr:3'-5' exonuclease [Alphaproteobacteria bacterium]